MTKKNPNGEVWVFAEQQDGKLNEVSLELLGKARQIANTLGVAVGAVLPGGKGVETHAKTLIAYGADRVYVVEDAKLE